MTYYPDWAPPNSIDYSLFDNIIFAFALPDQNYQLRWDSDQAPSLLASIVPAAHAAASKVSLSIGGWTGSRPVPYFSNAVATPQSREIFANNILDTYKQYDLDGIDIDWEYPGQVGQPGNAESATDSSNMLQFFKLLQQKLPPLAMISAAVQDSPFVGPDGHPMKDVSAFSQFVDWITLMNYDTYETREPPGPNAPLSDACGNSSQPNQNAVGAYNAWTAAGFPPHKLVLGAPAYGYIVQSNARSLSARSPSRAYSEDGSGQIQFKSLISQGILAQNPDGSVRPSDSSGFTRGWDDCSATPFLRSDSAGQVISYDDMESLGIKAAWVKKMNIGGINLFDVHGDTSQHHLTHALLSSTAVPPSSVAVTLSPNTIPSSTSTASSSTSAGPPSSGGSQPSPAPLVPTLPGSIVLTPHRN
ncbi:glycoside hydrolase family 18 protein [Boletus coccyginus]|nr:glycoside hydrolase family 18 protein [Boletus coccyginus]